MEPKYIEKSISRLTYPGVSTLAMFEPKALCLCDIKSSIKPVFPIESKLVNVISIYLLSNVNSLVVHIIRNFHKVHTGNH